MKRIISCAIILLFLYVSAVSLNAAYAPELSLSYDDRCDLSELGIPPGNYSIAESGNITSTKVSKGENTGIQDTALITLSGTELIASGVGTGVVTLISEDETYNITVTVTPAVLTIMFLAGQSNMEGVCDAYTGQDPGMSIACEKGTVYSTFVPRSSRNIAGVSFSKYCTKDDYSSAEDFVAGSLEDDTNMSGEKLEYSVSSLTDGGKTGPDSGLAWRWNALTGDKVWVVNAAYGGTEISEWVPGGACFERAFMIWKAALRTYEAEIESGHYVAGNRLIFWQQGETEDSLRSAEEYEAYFDEMYTAFCDLDFDALGIILVRAGYAGDELLMTGPRTAQRHFEELYDNVCIASDANEQWVTDEGVESYFEGKSYPTQSGVSLTPKTVADVHYDIHYSQTAHNENGITAAEGMYDFLNRSLSF